jgi:hypothetical protein
MTFIQVTGLRWRKSQYQWGAGILSVMGISFASVPLFTTVIKAQMVSKPAAWQQLLKHMNLLTCS